MLVNPKSEQMQAYKVALEALQILITELKPGDLIRQAYKAAHSHIATKAPSLKVHSNFGFGIGFQYMEQSLLINE